MSKATNLTNALLTEIKREFPYIVLWRNNRLEANVIGRGGKVRHVSAGIDGQGDLTGIIGHCMKYDGINIAGKRIEIEVKILDKMRPSQWAFKAMIEQHGGLYLVARSVEQCLADLAEAVGG